MACDENIFNQNACNYLSSDWLKYFDVAGIWGEQYDFIYTGYPTCNIESSIALGDGYGTAVIYKWQPIISNCDYVFKLTFSTENVVTIDLYLPPLLELIAFTDDTLTDYEVIATSTQLFDDNIPSTVFTFNFTTTKGYSNFGFRVVPVFSGQVIVTDWSLDINCNDCDEEQTTNDKYVISQDQITAAIEKAKCCYGALKASILNSLKAGLEVCKCNDKQLIQLDASIFALERYCKGGCNCITDNQAQRHIENINKLCGCTNC